MVDGEGVERSPRQRLIGLDMRVTARLAVAETTAVPGREVEEGGGMVSDQNVKVLAPAARPVDTALSIPGSKSVTNRALLLAALASGTSTLSGLQISDDAEVFLRGLQALGFELAFDPIAGRCRVNGGAGRVPAREATVWCGQAGTAARFLLAAAAAGHGRYAFDGDPQLRARPIGPLIEALATLGARAEPAGADRLPLTLHASGLSGGRVVIPGNQSSQYHSAVLMAAPLARSRVEIVTSDLVSRPYIDLTCTMMEEFGVRVERQGYERLAVDAPASYEGRDYVVEADASTASYFFAAAAATGGRLTVENISRSTSRQGDIRFLDVLERMGCRVHDDGDGTTVVGTEALRGIETDMKDISDTFMTLACLAPFADGPVTITGIGNTRLKESDRIAAVQQGLESLGIRTDSGADFIRVYPGVPRGARISSHGDHRIAMAFSIVGLRTPGVVIEQANSVSKTCPVFFDLWDQLV